jgi:hypothetical protein
MAEAANVIRAIAKTSHLGGGKSHRGYDSMRSGRLKTPLYRTQSDLRTETIDAFKLTDLVKVSVELLQDSCSYLEDILQKSLPVRLVCREEAF